MASSDSRPLFVLPYEITDVDIEPQYQHVHHAHAIRLMERSREQMLIERGIPNERFIARGELIVIAALTVRYRRELLRGSVEITCDEMRIPGKVFTLSQRIIGPGGETAVSAEVQMVFMSRATKRAIAPPPEFLKQFGDS